LTGPDYERLRGATETHREELVLRLAGEVGLRAAEVVRVRPADRFRDGDGDGGCFLTVRAGDGTGEEGAREAYVPADLAHEVAKYVRSHGVEETEPIVDVSPRRVQMIVSEVAARAADRHDRPDFADVTPTTLRRLFARRLLRTNGVDPNVVCAVGGWERLDSLLAEAGAPSREEIADAFRTVSDDGRGSSTGRLSTVVEALDAVGASLADTGSPAAVRETVCERLAAAEPYRAAWFAERDHHRDGVSIGPGAGDSLDRAGAIEIESLVRQSFQTGTLMVAPDRESVSPETPGRAMLAAVPVVDGETDYGSLVARSVHPDAFDQAERTALRDLGRRIARRLTAVKRRRLLSGDSVLSLAVSYSDRTSAFVALSADESCTVELEGVVPAESGAIVSFVRATGATSGAVLERVAADDRVEGARLIRSFETEALLEVVLAESTPIGLFAAHGGKVVDLTVEDGRARLVGEFPPGLDVRTLVEAVAADYPSVELHSKQERAEPTESSLAVERALEDELTDKQRSVLRGAYHAGYFEWPRGSTAEELADSMGVSSPTLHNHLRRAQQKLVGTALDKEETGPGDFDR
jgi:predicted DNA binding protein